MIEPQVEIKDFQNHQEWLEIFRKKHGRSLRVLHIGNICNNSYNNAKLQNKLDLDCDVICYDYYHIMGCPEWEDADFEGNVRDQFFPNWHALNLNGFKRPQWFAQGPLELCIRYLLAKRSQDPKSAKFWWLRLNTFRFLRTCLVGDFYYRVLLPSIISLRQTYIHFKNAIRKWISDQISPVIRFKNTIKKIVKNWIGYQAKVQASPIISSDSWAEQFIETFKQKFPDRDDQLLPEDLAGYRSVIPLWKELFQYYDIVQGYSSDPILPLLAGKKYFALEHGTLRDFPFQKTALGRLIALSYSQAEHIFVTNSDCLENARFLMGGNANRVSFLNHPYDENRSVNLDEALDLRQQLFRTLDADFLFFFPTRQDWVAGKFANKANDVFLKAFCHLRQSGYKVGMVCCRWGNDVQHSIQLLREQQCADYVFWKEPMAAVQFERMVKACHIIVDQFECGAFGGVMFKAMAVGAPICTYLNEVEILTQYAEMPPVINCKTSEQVVQAVRNIISCPERLDNLSTASKQWIDKYHNSKQTIQIQLKQYERLLFNF